MAKFPLSRSLALVGLVLFTGVRVFAQTQPPGQALPDPHLVRALALNQIHYHLRAGERIAIDAPTETRDFMRTAKSRAITIDGERAAGLVIERSANGNHYVLAASLRAMPGEYAARVSAVSVTGEERAQAITVVLDPLRPGTIELS